MIRVPTGVPGLDRMIQGGIPARSVTAVSGPPGVGKSIFGLQYIHQGALRNEKCIYINLEEPRRNIDRTLKGLDFGDTILNKEKTGLIQIFCIDHLQFERVYDQLLDKIQEENIQRLVIDSFNYFYDAVQTILSMKRHLTSIFNKLRQSSSLIILEEHQDDFHTHITYLSDSYITMQYLSFGTTERRIFINKMRWTRQYPASLMFDITKKGIVIHHED